MLARMKLYKQGLNDKEIGEKLNVSASAIGYWRRKQGLSKNIKEFPVKYNYKTTPEERKIISKTVKPLLHVCDKYSCTLSATEIAGYLKYVHDSNKR